MKPKLITVSLILLVLSAFSLNFLRQSTYSIPPRNIKDVISNSQFSYYGGVGTGNTGSNTIIKIDTGTSFPSRTTNNLFVGDTLTIGLGGSQSVYIVRDIANTGTIVLNTGLSAVAVPYGGSIIATRSAIHTVSFEPTVNITAGIWQFLIKATSTTGEVSNDKIPDQGGFDAGAITAGAITCPWGATASVGTTTSVSLGSPSVTSYYHVIQCALGAGVTNPAGTGATGTIVIGTGSSLLVNPSATHSGTNEGNADIFTYLIRQLDGSSVLVDQAVGKIAVVESVRITATIDPTLTFTIDSIGTSSVGSTACGGVGTTLSSGSTYTTGDQVIFGSLGLNSNNLLAQRLSCVTNAPGGYVVTAYEDAAMRSIGTTSVAGVASTIPDTGCNGGGCTATSATAWTTISTSRSEFGYTMYNVGSSIPFVAGNYKPFGVGTANAQDIMKRVAVPTTTESAFVCYKITVNTTQDAGDYESKVTYTATATF